MRNPWFQEFDVTQFKITNQGKQLLLVYETKYLLQVLSCKSLGCHNHKHRTLPFSGTTYNLFMQKITISVLRSQSSNVYSLTQARYTLRSRPAPGFPLTLVQLQPLPWAWAKRTLMPTESWPADMATP